MFIRFEKLHEDAKIWIFYTEKPLNAQQLQSTSNHIEEFCEQWESHNLAVVSSYQLLNNQILIVGANAINIEIGGCSIDSLIKKIKEIGENNQIDFFCRELLIFDNKNLSFKHKFAVNVFKRMLKNNEISTDLLLLDTTIRFKKEIKGIMKPLHKTWLMQ